MDLSSKGSMKAACHLREGGRVGVLLLVLIASAPVLASCDRAPEAPSTAALFIPTEWSCPDGGDAEARVTISPDRAIPGERFIGSITNARPYEFLDLRVLRRSGSHLLETARSRVRLDTSMRADTSGSATFTVRSFGPGRYVLTVEGKCETRANVRFRTMRVAPEGFVTAATGGFSRVTPWTLALSEESCAGIGISFAYAGEVDRTCVAPGRAAAIRPVAFLANTLIAFASKEIVRARYDSFQTRSIPAQVLELRTDLLPSSHLVLVFGTGGADGDLISYDEAGEVRGRIYVGLPPACVSPRSMNCLM